MQNDINQTVVEGECQEDGWPIGKRAAFFSVFVVILLALLDGLDRQILAALLPYIKADFGLSDSQLGMLISIVNFSIAAFVIPTAFLVDRWSRKKTMALMCVVWSAATGMCALAGSYSHLLIGRFLVGAGEAGYNPAAQALLSAQFPKKFRSTALSMIQMGLTLGIPLGLALGGFIAAKYGWRHALGIVAIPGFILALLALFIKDFKTPVRTKKTQNGEVKQNEAYISTLLGFLKVPTLVLIFIGAVFFYIYGGTSNAWLTTYFVRYGGMAPQYAASLAAVPLVSSIVGFFLGGPIIDMFRRKFTNGAAIAMSFGSFMFFAGQFSALTFCTPGSSLQVVFFFVSAGCSSLVAIGGPTMIMDLVHVKNRASAAGMLVACQNILGLALGPIIAGVLSDSFSLDVAFMLLSTAPALAALCYLASIITFKKDREKIGCEEIVF